MINGNCTNKNCVNKHASKAAGETATKSKALKADKKERKSTRTKKSSKCVTYKLSDLEKIKNID
jgi:hypothetical protein